MKPEERDKLQRFRRNGAAGFDALYCEYGERIYRFSLRLCLNPTEAEDLTQEVFLAAYQSLPRFQGRSTLATWLYRIAVFQWRSRISRKALPSVPLEEAQHWEASGADPAETGLNRIGLNKALAALTPLQREAFLLVKGEGLLCREAANVLGIPVGTLKFRVHEAVIRLQSLLSEETEPLPVSDCQEVCREV